MACVHVLHYSDSDYNIQEYDTKCAWEFVSLDDFKKNWVELGYTYTQKDTLTVS